MRLVWPQLRPQASPLPALLRKVVLPLGPGPYQLLLQSPSMSASLVWLPNPECLRPQRQEWHLKEVSLLDLDLFQPHRQSQSMSVRPGKLPPQELPNPECQEHHLKEGSLLDLGQSQPHQQSQSTSVRPGKPPPQVLPSQESRPPLVRHRVELPSDLVPFQLLLPLQSTLASPEPLPPASLSLEISALVRFPQTCLKAKPAQSDRMPALATVNARQDRSTWVRSQLQV